MKIVIDIPEDEYKRIKEGKWEGNPLADYIENGTPLPKGHGRLIDADDLKKDLIYMSDFSDAKGVWEEDIDDAETIIEADKE